MSIVKSVILSFSKSSSEMAGQCQSLPFRPRVSRVCFTSASRSSQQGRNDESVDEVGETMDRAKEKTQQLKDSTEDTSNAVKEKTRQMKDSAGEKAQQMNQKTKDKAYEMRDKTMDAADKTKETTKGAAEKVADAAKQTVQKIKETVVGKSDEDDYKNEDAIHNHTRRNNKKL